MPISRPCLPAGKKSTERRRRAALAVALLIGAVSPAGAGDVAVPHLDARGQAGYRDFLGAGPHRAFVIAPGGTWAWKADEATPEAALEAALTVCRAASGEQRCVPYAVDGREIFDAREWPRLWGPYADAAAARRRPLGTGRGERFPDLAWRTPDGRPMHLSELRGKVVVLHFWGSWCRPCRQEMPELARVAKQLQGRGDIRLVPLQMREDFASARRWVEQQGLALPIMDSAAVGDARDRLPLATGGSVPDRDIAPVFPGTYVIDRHGLVVFSHRGPLADWPGYMDFMRDAAARSGR